MDFLNLVHAKREGKEHSPAEIQFIIDSVLGGGVDERAIAAWLMAVCCRGMTMDETAALTACMANSGETLDFSSERFPVVDKHSTGGVGDKTSLVLVPLLAACGLMVPKLSGRALEHTGGTLDKLESIPGFKVDLTMAQFIEQVRACGCAIASTTDRMVPADSKLYAHRNATATVDDAHLGTASVMSKKIAGGAKFILLDVKTGNGAFMDTRARAQEIAQVMIAVGNRLGRITKAVITNMDQPLGNAIGNWLEVEEAVAVLNNNGPSDVKELCLNLAALTLTSVGVAAGKEQALERAAQALASGAAFDQFMRMVSYQGGDVRYLIGQASMEPAKCVLPVTWQGDSCWVKMIDTRKVALAAKKLGSAATCGILFKPKIGSQLKRNQTIATIHGDNEELCKSALAQVTEALTTSKTRVRKPPLILEVVE